MKLFKEEQPMAQPAPSGLKELLNAMMKRRWYITAMVLGGFILINQ